MKESRSQIKLGAILSYVNLGIGSLIPFIYTPIMLGLLGQEEYGLYQLANSVIGYLSLLNFGLGLAITRYISKYKIEGNKEQEAIIFGFFIKTYCLLSVAVVLGGIGLAASTKWIFSQGLTSAELGKIRLIIIILSVNMAISFITSVFSAVVLCYERFVFRRTLDIVLTMLGPICNIIVLLMGYKSVGMAMTATLVQAITLPCYVYYCYKNMDVRPKFKKVETKVMKEIMTFSSFIFLGTVVEMLYWATDKVLLGALVGTAAVAVYNIGATFNSMIMNMSSCLVGVLVPRINGMVVNNHSKKELTELFIKVGRLQYMLLELIITGFICFGRAFLLFWVGSEYEDAYSIAVLTMVPLSIPLIQNVGFQIVVAQNKHQFRQIVYAVIAVINVVTTFFVIPHLGAIGAAICSCVAYFIGHGFAMNWYYKQKTGIDIWLFWKNIGTLSLVPLVLMTVVLYMQQKQPITSVVQLGGYIVVYSICYVAWLWKFGMNDYERGMIRGYYRK